jgi:hypothetical protein
MSTVVVPYVHFTVLIGELLPAVASASIFTFEIPAIYVFGKYVAALPDWIMLSVGVPAVGAMFPPAVTLIDVAVPEYPSTVAVIVMVRSDVTPAVVKKSFKSDALSVTVFATSLAVRVIVLTVVLPYFRRIEALLEGKCVPVSVTLLFVVVLFTEKLRLG